MLLFSKIGKFSSFLSKVNHILINFKFSTSLPIGISTTLPISIRVIIRGDLFLITCKFYITTSGQSNLELIIPMAHIHA